MNKQRQITILAFFAICILSCKNKEGKSSKKETKPETVYKTMQLVPRSVSGRVQLPGVMQPFEFVQMYPRVNGFVKTVAVDRGTIVRQGQVLLTLDAPEIEQQVAAAKLRYTQANTNYLTSKDRYQRLIETNKTPGTVAAYDLSAAAEKMHGDSATMQGEYASYKAQETMRGYLTVAAPFDGVITERNVHPGALVGPGAQNTKPILVLQQLSKLRLVVDVPETYAAQIKNGDTVSFKSNSLPGRLFHARVSRSSQSINNNFRSMAIEIDVDNTKGDFKPGMYAEVSLPVCGSTNAYVVPKTAIVTTTERKYIIVANNSIAKWVDITEGNQNTDSIEVFGNLQQGSEVITNATYQVRDGAVLR